MAYSPVSDARTDLIWIIWGLVALAPPASIPPEKDSHERTPLHLAAVRGDAKSAAALLEAGADVAARAQFDMTPLHWAALAGHAEVADLLLKRGADVAAKNLYGMTPLHQAGTAEVAKVLIGHGAPVGARDDRGMTPLHLARTGKVAKVLLEAGADIFATSRDGRRPMDMGTGLDWENKGVIAYAARAAARLQGERSELSVELVNLGESPREEIRAAGESVTCQVAVVPAEIPRLDPAQLTRFTVVLTRKPDAPEGEHPLDLHFTSGGRSLGPLSLRVSSWRSATPEDRGMLRLGKGSLRRAPSSWQWAAFALPILLVALAWWWARGRFRR